MAKPRRTQEDRSSATKDKLLQAALGILRDRGHAGLRYATVAEVSGVSRGGLLHHYPTKDELIAGVFERIVETMEDESRKRVAAATDVNVIECIVADARSRFFGDSYRIMLDILIASASEKSLEDIRRSLAERLKPDAVERWTERLAASGVEAEMADKVTMFLWTLIKGLAVRNLVQRETDLCERIIALATKLALQQCARHRR